MNNKPMATRIKPNRLSQIQAERRGAKPFGTRGSELVSTLFVFVFLFMMLYACGGAVIEQIQK